jgi:hypothetical protein
MHPPSIPTRFQTVHFDDGEEKAFNSTAKRFEMRVSDLPGTDLDINNSSGPGYYAKAAERLEHAFSSLSLSKKGLSGFASHVIHLTLTLQGSRFKATIINEIAPGVSPAKYTPSTPVYSQSLSSSLSPAFRKPIVPSPSIPTNAMVRTKRGFKPAPGPGEYSPERFSLKNIKGGHSAFNSKSLRSTEKSRLAEWREQHRESPGL